MKVLVTGSAGFVGSAIVRRFLGEGVDVRGIDCLTDYYDVDVKRQNLKSLEHPNYEHVWDDINTVDMRSLLDGIDIIIHQAGQPGVRKSWGHDFSIYVDANISATQRLLEATKSEAPRLQKFVYASSSSVYGEAESYPTNELATPRPRSPYGVTKLAAEHLCSLYASNFSVPTVSLRYFTVFGPGQRPDMAFTRFLRAAVLGEAITVYGTGNQIRDFTYVDDIVDANIRAATRPTPPGAVYNVAGGTNVSLNQAIDAINDVAGVDLKVSRIETVAGDVFQTGGDVTRIRNDLGWEPAVNLREGLQRHYAWAQSTFGGGS